MCGEAPNQTGRQRTNRFTWCYHSAVYCDASERASFLIWPEGVFWHFKGARYGGIGLRGRLARRVQTSTSKSVCVAIIVVTDGLMDGLLIFWSSCFFCLEITTNVVLFIFYLQVLIESPQPAYISQLPKTFLE